MRYAREQPQCKSCVCCAWSIKVWGKWRYGNKSVRQKAQEGISHTGSAPLSHLHRRLHLLRRRKRSIMRRPSLGSRIEAPDPIDTEMGHFAEINRKLVL